MSAYAPAPATTIEPCLELRSLFLGESAQRPAHVRADRHTAPSDDELRRSLQGEALQRCPHRAEIGAGRIAHRVRDQLGECRRQGRHGAHGARSEALWDRPSGPTKMSSPSSRYGANRSQGVSETFRPRKFGASSRSRSSTATGTGYPLRAANS